MASTLFVKNLPYKATEDEVSAHFADFSVSKVHFLKDKKTGRSTGIAFVDVEDAEGAVESLNGVDFQGRKLVVDKARPRPNTKQSYSKPRNHERSFRR